MKSRWCVAISLVVLALGLLLQPGCGGKPADLPMTAAEEGDPTDLLTGDEAPPP